MVLVRGRFGAGELTWQQAGRQDRDTAMWTKQRNPGQGGACHFQGNLTTSSLHSLFCHLKKMKSCLGVVKFTD